jgi:hypothetical protein
METTARASDEEATRHAALPSDDPLSALLVQPRDRAIRGLVSLCSLFSQQYQEAPETCRERAWWRKFNQVGIQLREELEQAKEEAYAGLSEQEIERAYLQLIHVAYFFAPGGIAETLWPTLPAGPEDRQAQTQGSTDYAFVFGAAPRSPQRAHGFSRLMRRLNQALGRNAPCGTEPEASGKQEIPGAGICEESENTVVFSKAREAS